jgi:hypothetical protein
MLDFVDVLAIGGDVGIWALVAIAWKFDKRLSHLEWWKKSVTKEGNNV